MTKSNSDSLETVLHRARSLGFLGPGPVRVHIDQATRYLDYIPPNTGHLLDLGSGGGLPGLPLAQQLTDLEVVLLDSSVKRCEFLSWAVDELGLGERIEVLCARAEIAGHDDNLRQRADVVVSRSFAAPHHAVECAMGLVRTGGRIIISEPPGGRAWPEGKLTALGLQKELSVDQVAVLTVTEEIGGSIPRRFKKQARSPLFRL